MDKYEYKVRADEIETLISEGDYAEAVKIADTIDWRRVKSVRMLCRISDLYKINRRYEDSRDILLLAYERHTGGRLIVYSLCELSIKLGEYVQAVEYYKEFVQMAPKDSGKYILQYKLYEAQEVSLEERIEVLEELKKADYREKWAYELAYLYHRVGLASQCVDECNEMVLWFGEGRYVLKALELKMLHEPLTQEQEIKYELMKLNGGSVTPEYVTEQNASQEESAEPAEEEAFSLEENILAEDTQEMPGNELNIHVKTVDVSPYNTINLQRELAESMKEILEDHNPAEELEDEDDALQTQVFEPVIGYDSSVEAVESEEAAAEMAYMEANSVEEAEEVLEEIAETTDEPQLYLRQDTDEMQLITDADLGQDIDEESGYEEAEEVLEDVQEEVSGNSEEVFFGNTSEVNIEEVVSELAQKNAARTPFSPILAADPKDMQPGETVANVQKETAPSYVQGKLPIASPDPAINNTGVIRTFHKPSGYDHILSQEYDGQISLVMPEEEKIEKQITGQISIEDVMAEWERMKQESERKRLEEIRKRVHQQTDTLFADFDESTKTGLLEELEKTMVAAALKEEKERAVSGRPKVVKVADIEKSAEAKSAAVKKLEKELKTELEESVDELEEAADMLTEEAVIEEVEAAAAETVEDVIEDADEVEELEEVDTQIDESEEADTDNEELEEAFADDDEAEEAADELDDEIDDEVEALETENVEVTEASEEEKIDISAVSVEDQAAAAAKKTTESVAEVEEDGEAKYTAREMTAAEREQFAPFIHHKRTRKQIVEAIDNISMASYTGNVLITGEEGTGSTALAKLLVKEIQLSDNNFSGKVAKISGSNMNKKEVSATLDKLSNGALIVEDASGMKKSTVNALLKELNQEEKGLIVMLEDTKADIEEMLSKYPDLEDVFNLRVDVEALDDQTLVKYAKKYALEQEYSIDDLGILALHTRIADMQTSDHEVTMAEIEELVDEAIYYADRKTPAHFFDVLFGKRYDEEDMIVLREKDFMHY